MFYALVGAVLITYFWGGFTSITSATDMVWIILMGGLGGTAMLYFVISYRMTEQSNLAPFSYFGIPLSFVLGWLFLRGALEHSISWQNAYCNRRFVDILARTRKAEIANSSYRFYVRC